MICHDGRIVSFYIRELLLFKVSICGSIGIAISPEVISLLQSPVPLAWLGCRTTRTLKNRNISYKRNMTTKCNRSRPKHYKREFISYDLNNKTVILPFNRNKDTQSSYLPSFRDVPSLRQLLGGGIKPKVLSMGV
jgi:hypothetical protein